MVLLVPSRTYGPTPGGWCRTGTGVPTLLIEGNVGTGSQTGSVQLAFCIKGQLHGCTNTGGQAPYPSAGPAAPYPPVGKIDASVYTMLALIHSPPRSFRLRVGRTSGVCYSP